MNKINDALSWWREGLVASLPDSLQDKINQKSIIQCTVIDERLVLNLVDKSGDKLDNLTISLSDDVNESARLTKWLKAYPQHEVVLCVDSARCLLKRISMPDKALQNLDEMIKFEVERQTPFSFETAYIGYRVNEDKALNVQSLISVTLAVVPRSYLTALMTRLERLMLPISSLKIHDLDESTVSIKVNEHKAPISVTRLLNYSLAVLATVLFFLVLYRPIVYYDSELALIKKPLVAAKKQAVLVSSLKDANELLIEKRQFIETKSQQYRSRLIVLSELAKLLPTHTWLEKSDVHGDVLTIRGESSSATDLVTLITDSAYFANARFNTPTTRNNKTGKERFSITATIIADGNK